MCVVVERRYGKAIGQLSRPQGLRLLSDGSGVIVTDCWNHRLVVLSLTGAVLDTIPLPRPYDVIECDGGRSDCALCVRVPFLYCLSTS